MEGALCQRGLKKKSFCRIGDKRLTNLQKHHKESPGEPRVLKSGGRKNNTRSLSLADTERVVRFITQYAEDHGVHLPGRVPGFKRDDVQVLPSSKPKSEVYKDYATAAEQAGTCACFSFLPLFFSFFFYINFLFTLCNRIFFMYGGLTFFFTPTKDGLM